MLLPSRQSQGRIKAILTNLEEKNPKSKLHRLKMTIPFSSVRDCSQSAGIKVPNNKMLGERTKEEKYRKEKQ